MKNNKHLVPEIYLNRKTYFLIFLYLFVGVLITMYGLIKYEYYILPGVIPVEGGLQIVNSWQTPSQIILDSLLNPITYLLIMFWPLVLPFFLPYIL